MIQRQIQRKFFTKSVKSSPCCESCVSDSQGNDMVGEAPLCAEVRACRLLFTRSLISVCIAACDMYKEHTAMTRWVEETEGLRDPGTQVT